MALGKQISKRDHFGIFLKIENIYLETLELIIAAALEEKDNKLGYLKPARIKIEILKRLVRNCLELKIIEDKNYLLLETQLQEISKMVNGWIKYLK